jgi:CRP-like cAMP-binding protein
MIAGVARASERETERRTKELREKLERYLAKDELKKALALLLQLEAVDAANARWPHKRGDVQRRIGNRSDAIAAYERAATLYAEAGFLPRSIAMAKVVEELSPKRTEVLDRIDAGAARAIHRRVRPAGVHAGERPVSHRVQEQALPFEPPSKPVAPPPVAKPGTVPAATPIARTPAPPPKLSPAPAPAPAPERARRRSRERPTTTIDIDLSELELAMEQQAEPRPADEPAASPNAEREACLPLLPLFAEAPQEALLQLARESELLRLGDGATVIRAGDPADALFGIVEGSVRVHVPGLPPEARPKLGAGEVFGEACLLSAEPRRADVVVEGELIALRIPKLTLSYLVRVHEGLADVLFELMTRRLITNLLSTAGLFAELSPTERVEMAEAFELRRAQGGATLLARGEAADAILIMLTGHVDIEGDPASEPPRVEGAGVMFGHATLLDGAPSGIGVRARETLLLLRLPRDAFARVAMQYPAMLMRMSELPPVARVAQ